MVPVDHNAPVDTLVERVSAAGPAVDEIFATALGAGIAPGIAYGVVGAGSLAHAGGVGQTSVGAPAPDKDSVFRIASMTKSFTAACVVMLRDEGALALDDPVSRHVPQLASLVLPTADSPPLTIRSLLTMSGGLPTDDPWADRQESMPAAELDRLLEAGLTFAAAPDTGFEYSNLGFVILGRVITNLTGAGFRDVVRTRLLEPLGLGSTCFAAAEVPAGRLVSGHHRTGESWVAEPLSAPGEFSALGGLFSTVTDIATWVSWLCAAFPARDDPEDGHPLSRASRRAMQQAHRMIDPRVGLSLSGEAVHLEAAGYGFGLVVEHDPRWGVIVSHSGGYPGFGSHMRWHPDSGLGVVALANGRYARAHQPAGAALAAVLESVAAPSRRLRALPALVSTRTAVEALLRQWDDAVADELFAPNVDLDLSRPERRAGIEAAVAAVGGLTGGTDPTPPRADSAAHLSWTVPGAAGHLQVVVRLTPHRSPLLQTLEVTAVPDPAPQLQQAYHEVGAALLASPPAWPDTVLTAPGVDVTGLVRAATAAAAMSGPLAAASAPTSSDGAGSAAWLLVGRGSSWRLSLTVQADGTIGAADLTPVACTADDHVSVQLEQSGPA